MESGCQAPPAAVPCGSGGGREKLSGWLGWLLELTTSLCVLTWPSLVERPLFLSAVASESAGPLFSSSHDLSSLQTIPTCRQGAKALFKDPGEHSLSHYLSASPALALGREALVVDGTVQQCHEWQELPVSQAGQVLDREKDCSTLFM